MKVRLALVGATLACGLALASPGVAEGNGRELGARMLGALNQVRAHHGLGAFRGSRSLRRSASGYARWMLRTDYFGHLGSIRASSRFSMLGEALAWNPGRRSRVSRTVRRWMHSPPHRALILHPGFSWLGAGIARGRLDGRRVTAWVLHLGGPLMGTGASALDVSVQPPSESQILSASPEIPSTTSAAGASRASAAP